MTPSPDRALEESPPLGGWARTYLAVAVLAVTVMALLWWFTRTFDIPLPRR